MTRIQLPRLPRWDSPHSKEHRHLSRILYTGKRSISISFRSFLSVIALLGILWSVMVSAESSTEHLSGTEQLDKLLKEVNTIAVVFKQTLSDEKGKVLETSAGIGYLERPGRFRWEYSEPYRQIIVADGDKVWFYDHDLSQVIVKPWDAFAIDTTPAALLTMTQPLEQIFYVGDLDIEETQDIDETQNADWQWVELTPKSLDATFAVIKIGFGDKGFEVMEVIDSFGQLTRLVFSKLNTNIELKSELFSFTPPEGVDVVGADTVESTPIKDENR